MVIDSSKQGGEDLRKWVALLNVETVFVIASADCLAEIGVQTLPAGWQCISEDLFLMLREERSRLLFQKFESDTNSYAFIVCCGIDVSLDRLESVLHDLGDAGIRNLALVFSKISSSARAMRHAMESVAFEVGYRKYSAYYLLLGYESLQVDKAPLVIPLELIPDDARSNYPLLALKKERDLHMDMLRESGERSDAHVIRYHLAVDLVRPGDCVLDAACGLGYGSYVIANLSRCSSVHGVDGSNYAINYARENFSSVNRRLVFSQGYLPDDLFRFPDECFDVIISFETLEHVEDPVGLLAEFSRLLRPGGRIIVSVPNDWGDESGKDPNPYHLHVYTLDKLRQQFSTFFIRKSLYQQIASGCKMRVADNRWMPLYRVLREIPVDTDMPPDSEWWIIAGEKPLQTASIDLQAPWYAAIQRPWSDKEPKNCTLDSIVLAVNCIPEAVDAGVIDFWARCAKELALVGSSLILVSTVPVERPNLHIINIPFLLPEFLQHYSIVPSDALGVSEREIMDVVSWYSCDYKTASNSLRIAHEYFSNLLDTLRPAVVLGWQSLNPVTRILRTRAQAADIPFWSGERGWVRNTLMFDLRENSFLSEVNTSMAITCLRNRHPPAASTVKELKARTLNTAELGRYKSEDRLSSHDLRARYGIPSDAKLVAFFSHGEPSLNALDQSTIRELHGLSSDELQQRLDAVTDTLLARGYWLLAQEHPFNNSTGRAIRLRNSSRVLSVSESVTTLLHAADYYLFTLTTLQFEAVFFEKPFGLLSRSPIYRAGFPPFIDDFDAVEDFIDAIVDKSAWIEKYDRLQQDVAFFYENLLLDIDHEHVAESAARLAAHLSQFRRPLDNEIHQRVERFLQKWVGG